MKKLIKNIINKFKLKEGIYTGKDGKEYIMDKDGNLILKETDEIVRNKNNKN